MIERKSDQLKNPPVTCSSNINLGSKRPGSIIDSNLRSPKMTNGKSQKDKSLKEEVIYLSEDESDTEVAIIEPDKENKLISLESKNSIRRIENELRDEENLLLLMQQLRASQKPNPPARSTPNPKLTTALNSQKPPVATPSVVSTPNLSKSPAPVVTKQVALYAIEQQFGAKRSALKKHLEKALEKVSMPTPNSGIGLSEVAFVPSALSNEFTSLIGLEEVCRSIQEYDAPLNKNESRRVFSPFACSRCKTDFTPVWKRERPGVTGVVCEACLSGGHKDSLQKDYENSIKAALKQHSNAEKDLEKEYEDLVNKPEKLDAFMKEHEKKLLAAAQQSNPTVQNKVYNNKSVPNQNVRPRAVNGLPQSQASSSSTSVVTSTPSATTVACNANNQSVINAQTLQQLTPIQQAQLLAQLQQQQQLAAAVAKSANTPGSANLNANSLLAVASGANPQAQQLQQQQLLASVLANLQPQQQLQTNDQMNQFQNALLSSLMNQNRQQGTAANRQQQLIQQTLMHFTMLQQQAVQQNNVQQQQQQQAVYNALAQQQQMALLHQMVQQQQQQHQISQVPQNQQQATLNLLQNLHSFGVTSQQTGGKK